MITVFRLRPRNLHVSCCCGIKGPRQRTRTEGKGHRLRRHRGSHVPLYISLAVCRPRRLVSEQWFCRTFHADNMEPVLPCLDSNSNDMCSICTFWVAGVLRLLAGRGRWMTCAVGVKCHRRWVGRICCGCVCEFDLASLEEWRVEWSIA